MKNQTSYNKRQRNRLYVLILEKLSDEKIDLHFVCNHITTITNIPKEKITAQLLPELFLFKREVDYPWLALSKKSPTKKDNEFRKTVINLCIEMTK